ncbi:hypothetical protein [Ideonella sp. BN130291]|uniref:hypothetical protein n=1 Tax=Ideonella sp. BN130291 TaxID=3112940 RepID=UPI002E262710|nr:hypothetical protein [Ideonella sp. BN130291]
MALNEHSSFGRAAGSLFSGMLAGTSAPSSRVYRCTGCGEELTFDALAVSCRCTEECYGPVTAVQAAADPALHH